MNKKLFAEAIGKFAAGVLLVGMLIFLPAGTLEYRQGWLLMAILFIPMFVAGIAMMILKPELLKKRLNAREKQMDQRMVVKISGLMFLLGFIIAGLNYRFQWHVLPEGVSLAGAAVFLLAYLIYGEVLRENAYLSRVIEVQEGQQVVDTGLYGIVRHPMYAATLLLFLAIPVVLGSLYALVIFLAYPFVIVRRIKGEEELLKKELKGYREYCCKVKYRLIPYIW